LPSFPYSYLPSCPFLPTYPLLPFPFNGIRRYNTGKILEIADARRRVLAHFGNIKQQFNTPGFMLVNFSNSVELEILQVGEKLNEQ
jgi:hypothetical protein